ncbi:nicotinamide-nucleotide amidohydrolase family protein [Arachnia propionica]|uniref:Nicotinamide-nucleotide amidohydrolase family protein n=1 Tax=Arachnia propionica TaxID=1750 RepID=A0A3P1TC62_9ACTN|nr:nicotinamide-nucleotide amidohydrolase family protein [Arachnia propionica]RRD06073.1 nicotinamide-nucleotide amidohydrolase family protein [Arachnia propionica]
MNDSPATALIEVLRRHCFSVATAESLTAGLVSATLADISGASTVLLGGVVAYSPALKRELLGVSREVLETHGTVHAEVARQMARGAQRRLGADLALATTGVAGPGPAEGHPPGTGFIALALPSDETLARPFTLTGSRNEIRAKVVDEILTWATVEIAHMWARMSWTP